MNLKTIQDLSYKDKKMLVAEVCLMYKKLRNLKNLNLSINGNVLKDVNSSQKTRTRKTVSILESIFSLLDAEQAIVIENDFINKQKNGWYNSNWSKTTYYRIKHEAIDQFLYLLYA